MDVLLDRSVEVQGQSAIIGERQREGIVFIPEADVVVLELRRPVPEEGVLDAGSEHRSDPLIADTCAEVPELSEVVAQREAGAIIGLHPSNAALEVEHQAVVGEADAAGERRYPVVARRAGQYQYASRSTFEIGPGELGLYAEDQPRRHLKIVAGLHAPEEPICL